MFYLTPSEVFTGLTKAFGKPIWENKICPSCEFTHKQMFDLVSMPETLEFSHIQELTTAFETKTLTSLGEYFFVQLLEEKKSLCALYESAESKFSPLLAHTLDTHCYLQD
jgi:hypothetical protein